MSYQNEAWSIEGQKLIDDIQNKKVKEGNICLWRLGQCGVALKYKDKIVLVDLMLNDLVENGVSRRLYDSPFSGGELVEKVKIDYVFCTHGHLDHLAPETVGGLMSAELPPTFIVPSGCKSLMEDIISKSNKAINVLYVSDGQNIKLDEDISVKAFSAAHPEHYLDEADERMALCFEIELGRKSVLHLGDTYLTERLFKALSKLDRPSMVLLPINGDDLFRKMRDCIGNMEAEEAAKLVFKLAAGLAIPTHYDMVMDNTADPRRFIDELERLGVKDKGRLIGLGESIEF